MLVTSKHLKLDFPVRFSHLLDRHMPEKTGSRYGSLTVVKEKNERKNSNAKKSDQISLIRRSTLDYNGVVAFENRDWELSQCKYSEKRNRRGIEGEKMQPQKVCFFAQ